MRQFHRGQLRGERLGDDAMVVHAHHRNILAHAQPPAGRTFVHRPRTRIIEAEETIRILPIEELPDLIQRRPVVQHIDDQPLIVADAGLLQGLAVPLLTQVLRDHRLAAPDVGDAPATGMDQPVGGVLGDHDLVRFHAGNPAFRIGGVHQHHRGILQRIRHMRDAVRHLGVHETIHAIPLQRGDLRTLVGFAVGADGEHDVSQSAGRVLRSQDDAAGVRGCGDLLADEAQDMGPAGTQAAGQRIGTVPQLLRGLPHPFGDFGFHPTRIAMVHHQRHRGYRNSRLLRHLLHRRHASNDTRLRPSPQA